MARQSVLLSLTPTQLLQIPPHPLQTNVDSKRGAFTAVLWCAAVLAIAVGVMLATNIVGPGRALAMWALLAALSTIVWWHRLRYFDDLSRVLVVDTFTPVDIYNKPTQGFLVVGRNLAGQPRSAALVVGSAELVEWQVGDIVDVTGRDVILGAYELPS